MPATVFISYSHHQGDWVWNRLAPVLRAADVHPLVDRDAFEAARALKRQMDEAQDRAEHHLLVLSPEYLASKWCQHEMKRSIARDPSFDRGITIPILRVNSPLPAAITRPAPLYVDLRDDSQAEPWEKLLEKCQGNLKTTAPEWLRARDSVIRHLDRGESVNLVVARPIPWRPIVEQLRSQPSLNLGVVHLESIEATTRPSLVREILTQCGTPPAGPIPPKPNDLLVLGDSLKRLPRAKRLALTSFDLVVPQKDEYGLNLFLALRDLIMDSRKLVLLSVSRAPFATLLPTDHPLSEIQVQTVELLSRR